MDLLLGTGGGFLVAVIWMDLMFDVLALGPVRDGELAEDSLAQIATYYRRVTTTASPMNVLVSAVMAALVGTLARQLYGGEGDLRVTLASLVLCGVPIVLALLRVFPNAIRLGTRRDPRTEQSRLARSIAIDHLLCLAAMLAFLALRFAAAR